MKRELEVMRRFIAEYQTAGKQAVAEELLAPDFVDHTPFPGFGQSRDDVIQLFAALRGAFPDLRAEIVSQFSQGDRVGTHKVFSGTHQGPLMGIPPTGKQVSFAVMDIVRIADGRIAEHWNVVDQADLMRQLASS